MKTRYLTNPIQLLVLFIRTMASIFRNIAVGKNHRISPAFAEKLMLAVTGVNDCKYCSYLHTKTALEKGVTDSEIAQLLRGQFDDFQEEEAVGIVYAQHWAEERRNPSLEARSRAIEYYGETKVKNMEMYMSVVYLGNMCSNTVMVYKKMPKEEKTFGQFAVWLLAMPVAFGIKKMGGYRE